MELTLDRRPCDLGPEPVCVPGFDAAATADLAAAAEGRAVALRLPPTPRNAEALGDPCDPASVPRFHDAAHTACLTAEGALLIRGRARLLSASEAGYTLEIRTDAAGWAREAARRMFDTLGVVYETRLTPAAILASWTEPTPVRFFPVWRDAYPERNSGDDLLPELRLLTTDDYHPFLHLETVVRQIFADAGYRVESRFLASDFFRSLYMSGAYMWRKAAGAEARMGFCARRLASATAEADHLGRVYADPAAPAGLGNFVDTAAAGVLDADGEPIPELYDRGHCFRLHEGRAIYAPPTRIRAGFEYTVRYTTDHRILSRTRLAGFDTLFLGEGSELAFALPNRYADRREALAAARSYRAVVFDHTEGSRYRLTATVEGRRNVVWASFESRTAAVATPPSGTVADAALERFADGAWQPCDLDWALYDGYVGERGRTTVNLRVRAATEIVSEAQPKRFDAIYFAGAEPGMRFTLDKACFVRPFFHAAAGFGSRLTFADVAHHRIRQSTVLEAAAHLFNLRFLTDEATKTVTVEPADDMLGQAPEVDWRAKCDPAQGVAAADRALGLPRMRTWRYGDSDGSAARFDEEAPAPLGAWTYTMRSSAAEGEREAFNPLFHPSLSAAGYLPEAPSAAVVQVGDRDLIGAEDPGFTPRIVRYRGMRPLPAGERWGFPSFGERYPLAAFHFAGDALTDGFTLCFEDRDGQRGLHRFHDREVEADDGRERLEMSLRLDPDEFEALLTPGTGMPSVRSAFRLRAGAGEVVAALSALVYDPGRGLARCTFDRLPEDRLPDEPLSDDRASADRPLETTLTQIRP